MASKVAFLGLGIMGGSMAANLARSGASVNGWNRTPGRASAERAAQSGVSARSSAEDAVAEAEIVFLCLTDEKDISELLLGARGIVRAIRRGSLVVDMSTSGPQCARELHHSLSQLGLRFLDAPVSGGDVGAREGTLTIMVGGNQQDFEECRPSFEAMGKNIWYCGPAGSGQAVKLCNQVLCAVNMLAVCEAFELAAGMDISAQLVVDVCKSGAAGSWALSTLGARIVKGDLAPGFKLKDMLKDLRLVTESVQDANRQLPATSLAEYKFIETRNLGGTTGGDQGTQAMVRAYRRDVPQNC